MKLFFLPISLILIFLTFKSYAVENVTFINANGKVITYDYFIHGRVELDNKERCRTTAARRTLYSNNVVIRESEGFTANDCLDLNSIQHTERSLFCTDSEDNHLTEFSDYSDLVDGMNGAKRKLKQLAAKIYVKCMAMGRKRDAIKLAYESTDSDGDGVFDPFDECPYEGDIGFGVDDDGCPLGDSDGDGIIDAEDEYPNDFDNDGIPTTNDADDTLFAPNSLSGPSPLETQAGIIRLQISTNYISLINDTNVVNGGFYYAAAFSVTYTLDYSYEECTNFIFGSCATWTPKTGTSSAITMHETELLSAANSNFVVATNDEIPTNQDSNYRNVRINNLSLVSSEVIAEKN